MSTVSIYHWLRSPRKRKNPNLKVVVTSWPTSHRSHHATFWTHALAFFLLRNWHELWSARFVAITGSVQVSTITQVARQKYWYQRQRANYHKVPFKSTSQGFGNTFGASLRSRISVLFLQYLHSRGCLSFHSRMGRITRKSDNHQTGGPFKTSRNWRAGPKLYN